MPTPDNVGMIFHMLNMPELVESLCSRPTFKKYIFPLSLALFLNLFMHELHFFYDFIWAKNFDEVIIALA